MIYLISFFYHLIGDVISLKILSIHFDNFVGEGGLLTPVIHSLLLPCPVLWKLTPLTCISQTLLQLASSWFNWWESLAVIGGQGRGQSGQCFILIPSCFE